MDDQGASSTPRFRRWPEPKAIGHAGRGHRILAGHLTLAGRDLVGDPFALRNLPLACRAKLHGFAWLDDLAAVASQSARDLARLRIRDWLMAHPAPDQDGLEWRPEVMSSRLLRWLFHAGLILPGADHDFSAAFHGALHQHLSWLVDCWPAAPDGSARLQALTALFLGAVHLQGPELQGLALQTLTDEAVAMGQGVLYAPRRADDLLESLSCLVWSADGARLAGLEMPQELLRIAAGLAATLRGLRHSDGGLPQFHGSSRGLPGRLDQMLAAAPGPAVTAKGQPLGLQRLLRGRVSVMMDVAPAPDAATAHASALAFEMVDARQPLILSCGPGMDFGPLWTESTRRSHCHSMLLLAGQSAGQFGFGGVDGPDQFHDGGSEVWAGDYDSAGALLSHDCGGAHRADVAHVLAGHDGWLQTYGVTHLRELWLSAEGDQLTGQDSLAALTPEARQRLAGLTGDADGQPKGIGFDIRFHLHPAVLPAKMGDTVDLTLPDGRCWCFSHDAATSLRIEPSVWLDPDQAVPVASHQIVLSGILREDALQIGWTLARSGVS